MFDIGQVLRNLQLYSKTLSTTLFSLQWINLQLLSIHWTFCLNEKNAFNIHKYVNCKYNFTSLQLTVWHEINDVGIGSLYAPKLSDLLGYVNNTIKIFQ